MVQYEMGFKEHKVDLIANETNDYHLCFSCTDRSAKVVSIDVDEKKKEDKNLA